MFVERTGETGLHVYIKMWEMINFGLSFKIQLKELRIPSEVTLDTRHAQHRYNLLIF